MPTSLIFNFFIATSDFLHIQVQHISKHRRLPDFHIFQNIQVQHISKHRRLPDFQTSELPNFRTSELPNFRTSELPNFRTSELPNFCPFTQQLSSNE
jgi:hypothetical protein